MSFLNHDEYLLPEIIQSFSSSSSLSVAFRWLSSFFRTFNGCLLLLMSLSENHWVYMNSYENDFVITEMGGKNRKKKGLERVLDIWNKRVSDFMSLVWIKATIDFSPFSSGLLRNHGGLCEIKSKPLVSSSSWFSEFWRGGRRNVQIEGKGEVEEREIWDLSRVMFFQVPCFSWLGYGMYGALYFDLQRIRIRSECKSGTKSRDLKAGSSTWSFIS